MNNKTNISSIISPNILENISASSVIKTFGNQIKEVGREIVITSVVNKTDQLEKQIKDIIPSLLKIEIEHSEELKRLSLLYSQNQITQDQYNKSLYNENIAYVNSKKDLEELKSKLQQDLKNTINDPLKRIKEEKQKRKKAITNKIAKNKSQRAKSRSDLSRKVAKNAAKTLVPVIALQLANKFISLTHQRMQLEKLVDQVNDYIDHANTPETITIAISLKNNAITLINNNIGKVNNIYKIISQLNTYISIFTAIVAVLSAIPIPTSVPPGIGIPVSLIMRIVKQLDKASKLIISLNVLSAIVIVVLENEINKLNELIERLKEINQLLDDKSLEGLNNGELNKIIGNLNPTPGDGYGFGYYKGFRFDIKTEQNKVFEVKGNKRHYAVAIDKDGVEVLKSEYSFTLDPNDLVDQLKLIIDQQQNF